MLTPFTVIAGPCVIEDEKLVLEIAQELKAQLHGLPIHFFFKASFDKANRSSVHSFRGPGLNEGLRILEKVKGVTGLKVLTDIHTPDQAEPVAQVADAIQIPAFLCRQTDLIQAGALAALEKNRVLNIKKGQFLAPWDCENIVQKVREIGLDHSQRSKPMPINPWFYLTERGSSFGYNTLVVDMISFQCIKKFSVPVLYDATHSVQTPGGGPQGRTSGGKREYIETLARAAVAAGADGIFLECHPHPENAKSDGPNAFLLEYVGAFIKQMLSIYESVRQMPKFLIPKA